MDPIKDISLMMPRLDIIRLREAGAAITYDEMVESWSAVRRGENFWDTTLGKQYRKTRK